MKAGIHPTNFRKVIFEDSTSGTRFLIGSTVETAKTALWDDGKEYPLFVVEVSSASHPFYTGVKSSTSRATQVAKFNRRASSAKGKK